ncbi:uncharacterized protein LOC117340182 [Pecten maximus]|uniref:uncharacterized protein LOC117340182 n=1 Tax=Pecten maximus TaxID=6579 RepID=UPI00145839C5|nr:uncharacterized protein LOC117340182 [Pecten maximus]
METKKTRWIIFYPGDGVPVQIPKHDDVLHLAEKQVENLKKDSDVKRFLTFSFENEIFAYAEEAFKYVQSRMADKAEQHQEKWGMIDLKIRSLLVRKLPEHDTSTFLTSDEQPMENKKFRIPSSQHIKERLAKRSLQDCGIRGFCSTAKGILVFAAQPEEHTDRIDIVNRIRECFGEEKTEVVLVESIMTSHLVANGDILTNKTSSSRRTLGCFGKVGDSLVAITAGHCVQAGDMMQITDEDNRLIEFGNCTESYYQQDVDIAIIKMQSGHGYPM